MKPQSICGKPALIFAVVAAVCLLSAVLQSGQAEDKNPAKALVAASVKAMGGEKKARSWKTMTEKGQLVAHWEGWGELHSNYTREVTKPDKMKIDQDFTAYDHPFFFTYYYNGGDVWAVVNLGVRQNERYTKRLTKNMRTVDGMAYYLADCDTFYLVTDVADDSLVAAAGIDRVGVVDQGDTVLFDLNKKTHLPVRRIEDRGSVQVLFSDYRKTKGLMLPYTRTVYQEGAVTEEQKLDEIVFDQKIDDAIFEEFRPKPKK
jgi:hypothetical protein